MNKYMIFREEKYERFKDVLTRCGMYIIDETTENIECIIFEDLCIDVPCYLCDENLDIFWKFNMIDGEIKELAIQFRQAFANLEKDGYWNVESIRHSNNWRKLFELSEIILNKLYY